MRFILCCASLVLLTRAEAQLQKPPSGNRDRYGAQLREVDRGKRVELTVQRLSIHEILSVIARKHDLQIVVAPYWKPRNAIRVFHERGQELAAHDEPLENVLDFIAYNFVFRWRVEGDVYVFENRLWFLDEPYRLRSETVKFAEQHHGDSSFEQLANFLRLTEHQREALAEQHPEVNRTLKNHPRRMELEAYNSLPVAERLRLNRGELIRLGELRTFTPELTRWLQEKRVETTTSKTKQLFIRLDGNKKAGQSLTVSQSSSAR